MSSSGSLEGYLHFNDFDQFERDAFDKKKIRAGMRKIGRVVTQRARMKLKSGNGQAGYPNSRTGATLKSIMAKVSRSGFMVKAAPRKTSAMKAYYPAFLHYGVKRRGANAGPGASQWRIKPRDNYMADALQDSAAEVQSILSAAFAAALG
jgi:hypothetical protein